jgi:hypothetical protein
VELPKLVIETAASLVAILALTGLALWMKLGGTAALADDAAVRRAAGEVEYGFAPVAITRDAQGQAALARDGEGQIMVIKRHGNRFAGRILGSSARATIWRDPGHTDLEVDCGEPRFGTVFLALPDPEAWAEAINRLGLAHDA